ncbi:Uncharacterised protein [uncultured archaeon]|nr:Uncharacterised protein [uncultured archaeon]
MKEAPWQIYDRPKSGVNLRRLNLWLKRYNLVMHATRRSPRMCLAIRDESKPVPTNWCMIADTCWCKLDEYGETGS